MLQEYITVIFVGFLFALFPAWWLWTATILKALIRDHKSIPNSIVATMWPNRYKQRGVGHSYVNSTINGFQFGQYIWGAVILLAFGFGVVSDIRHDFPIFRDFTFPAAYLMMWLLPNYLLKRKINKMKTASIEWVDAGRF